MEKQPHENPTAEGPIGEWRDETAGMQEPVRQFLLDNLLWRPRFQTGDEEATPREVPPLKPAELHVSGGRGAEAVRGILPDSVRLQYVRGVPTAAHAAYRGGEINVYLTGRGLSELLAASGDEHSE